MEDLNLTPEEQESLAIGENIVEQEQQLLADKFQDVEALEKAYLELQSKLGKRNGEEQELQPQGQAESQEGQEAESEDDGANEEEAQQEDLSPAEQTIADASAEWYEKGSLSDETLEKFNEMSSRELVDAYLKSQAGAQPQQVADLSDTDINQIKNQVGGEAAYQTLVDWAAENLPEQYTKAFDDVVDNGQLAAIQLAVAGLQRQYELAVGYEGNLRTGKGPVDKADVFRSNAEVVQAMSDPRYDNDPAYRNDVFQKLERSNIEF